MIQKHGQKAKVRLVNTGRGSLVAKARQDLYRHCTAQATKAIKQGFYLESIALIESMITDRLESRIAAIHGQDEAYRKFRTIGFLLHGRGNKHDKSKAVSGLLSKELREPEDLVKLYLQVEEWSARRNACLHQMVKLDAKSSTKWNERVANAKEAAEAGMKIFRDLSALIAKHRSSLPSDPRSSSQMPEGTSAAKAHPSPP